MPGTPKNPNVERVAELPFDKDGVSPVPQYAPRLGAPVTTGTAVAPLPGTGEKRPPAREEYPGPQTSSTGERVEPGREQKPADTER